MSNNKEKIRILSSLLGAFDYDEKLNEVAFFCPNCHHRKKKLMINLNKNVYKCWVCNEKFSGKIVSLFKRMQRTDLLNSWYSLNNIDIQVDLKSIINSVFEKEKKIQIINNIELPLGSTRIDLTKKQNQFKNYLYNRGYTDYHIEKYKIMSCETEGKFKNRVIIPSFDINGNINYYVARSIYENNIKYLNPAVDKKNLIFNELFIDWSKRIIIVEGVFDAIKVDDNAIPLLGSSLGQSAIRDNILKYKPDVYFMLDNDAYSKQLNMIEKFLGWGINIYNVILDSKDPADTSKQILLEKIKEAKEVNFKQLMISKIE